MRIALIEPPHAVRPVFAVLGALFIVVPAALGVIALLVGGHDVPVALLVPLALFLVPVAGGLRAMVRKRRTGELVLDDDHLAIDLPGAPPLRAPLLALRVLRAARPGLVVGTEERALVVPARSLGAAQAADVVDAVLARLRAGDEGARLAEFLVQRDAAAGSIERRRLGGTYGVAAVLALVFALEIAAGVLADSAVLLELGAARRDLVLDGFGAWRVPAAALLHGHVLHVALNLVSLVVLGPVLERWLGTWRFLLVLLGAALVGTGASALLRTDIATVGLSGGLFGLLGALATTTVRYRAAPLVGPRLPLRSWVVLVVANAVLTAAPGVDAWAHVGGALAGALLAIPLTPSVRASAAGARERVPSLVKEPQARALALVVLAVFAVGLAGIARAFQALP